MLEAIIFLGIACASLGEPIELEKLELSEPEILRSYHNSAIIPSCELVLTGLDSPSVCFQTATEDEDDPISVLHSRFLTQLNLGAGEFAQLETEDSTYRVEKALCTRGVLMSCALDRVLKRTGSENVRLEILWILSGSFRDSVPYDEFYPKGYNPIRIDDFEFVLTRTIPRISDFFSRRKAEIEKDSASEDGAEE